MSEPRQKLITTAPGSNPDAFGLTEWSMLSATSLIWGSSFLWISIALRSLEPTAIGFVRVLLGAAALALIPRARSPIARADWPRVAIVGIAGSAGPALLFALAQQTVDSSVAGMVNSATPLVTMLIAILITRSLPGKIQGPALRSDSPASLQWPCRICLAQTHHLLDSASCSSQSSVMGSLQRLGSVATALWRPSRCHAGAGSRDGGQRTPGHRRAGSVEF